ncbi:hypothetical protein QQS21_009865 [Conoideocrella luteorostrata]|uniref:Uncharacterized protein n=1 Tax=Conoideocrella luteorostrata TaxID=1105319 RepID=A0AAJ0CG57_9HYPO|nr:hypothetical protein QQS21_009865 [Conoideocrella luteorostrata]
MSDLNKPLPSLPKGKGKEKEVKPYDSLTVKDLAKAYFSKPSALQTQEWTKLLDEREIYPSDPLYKVIPKCIREERERQEAQKLEEYINAVRAAAEFDFKSKYMVHDTSIKPETLEEYAQRYTVDPDAIAAQVVEREIREERREKAKREEGQGQGK